MMIGVAKNYDYDNIENYTSGEYPISNMDNDLKATIRGDLNDDISIYKYYILDMEKLVNNYGVPKGTKGYGETEDDVYIIEEKTRNIYYIKKPYPFVSEKTQESPEDMELEMIEVPGLSIMATEYLYGIYYLRDGTFYFSIEDNYTYNHEFYYYDGSTVTKLNLNNYYAWDTNVYETSKNEVYFGYGTGELFKLTGATATKIELPTYAYYPSFIEYNGITLFQDENAGTLIIDNLSVTQILDGQGYSYGRYSYKDGNLYISKYSYNNGYSALYRFNGIEVQELFNVGYNYNDIGITIDDMGNLYAHGYSDYEGYYIKKLKETKSYQ